MNGLVDIYFEPKTGNYFLVDNDTNNIYGVNPNLKGMGTITDFANIFTAIMPTVNNLISGGSGGQQYQQVASNMQIPYAQFQNQIDLLRASQDQKSEGSQNNIILIGAIGAILVMSMIAIMVMRK